MEVTKCQGKRRLVQIVEWKSESQSKSGGQGFPFLCKHSASGVGASSSLSFSSATGIVAGSNVSIRSLEDFPADVIINILSRLPLKSLVCCRCVCKIWCSIIDSPSFINMHFTSWKVDTAEEPQLMHAAWGSNKIRLSFLMDDGSKVLRSSEFPIAEIAGSGYVVESLCYGLICFRNSSFRGHVFLLNPLKRDVLMLPPATVTRVQDCYGVGFDCTTETYKVVHVFTRKIDHDSGHQDLATEVYTLGTSSWREIPMVSPYLRGGAVSAYGDIHWIGQIGRGDGIMIMSFDIRKEEFKSTPHPNLPTKLSHSFHLLNFRGHLAMVDNSSTTHIEVWVLKDYDKKEWVRECRISAELLIGRQILNIDHLKKMLGNVSCIGPWEHGLLFDLGHKSLCYYDPKTDSLKFRCIPDCNVPSYNERIFGYIGSLVSLKNFGNMTAREAGLRNYFDLSTAPSVCLF